jgi:hypothetical protein
MVNSTYDLLEALRRGEVREGRHAASTASIYGMAR